MSSSDQARVAMSNMHRSLNYGKEGREEGRDKRTRRREGRDEERKGGMKGMKE